jgi:hypothetical protein
MKEISIYELEKDFDDIMNRVENGEKFLIRTPDSEGIILTNVKDESIQFAESQGIIKEYK